MSEKSCDAIFEVLTNKYSKVGVSIVNCVEDLELLAVLKPDLVFLGMKFLSLNPDLASGASTKLWISEFLDEHGIAYTGSDKVAQNLEQHKSLAKQRVIRKGLRTAPFFVVKQSYDGAINPNSLEFPLFVKPLDMGGGKGIGSDSVVGNITQLNSKVCSIASDLKSDVIIEEYLTGREFSVAILKNELSDEFDIMAVEIVAPMDEFGQRILSRHIKLENSENSFLIPDKKIQKVVCGFAMSVFNALEARDYGRIDIRLDRYNDPHFLEANLIPSLKRSSGNYFPKSCLKNLGLEYDQMILRIVRLAFDRSKNTLMSTREEIQYVNNNDLVSSTVLA